MNIDLTKIIVAIIGLIATVIGRYLIPLLISLGKGEKRKDAIFWTGLAVQAAEMLFRDKGAGALKKDYVKDFLASHGFYFTDQEIDVAIESAVYTMQTALADASAPQDEPIVDVPNAVG